MRIQVLDKDHSSLEERDLPDDIFLVSDINHFAISQVIRWQKSKLSFPYGYTKTRSEISGSRRKIYKQKGTGRARHSDKYAPQFKGGGIVHGPRPSYAPISVPKKVRTLALKHVLAHKISSDMLRVYKNFDIAKPSSKDILSFSKEYKDKKILFIDIAQNKNLQLSVSNLKNVNYLAYEGLNVLSLISTDIILITEDCISSLEKRFGA